MDLNTRLSRKSRILLIKYCLFSLFLPVSFSFGINTAFAATACVAGGALQNNIGVEPSHGQVFYIDTGVTPKLDAGYIGYRVTNRTGSTQTHLWAQVSNFTGIALALNNSADSVMELPSLANSATGTAYFLLKGTAATTAAQGHTLKVYNDRPDLSSATLLYTCDFTFTKVQETIKAASNKVADNTGDSIGISVSTTTPQLGQTLSITVEGTTGTIGNGSSPDGSIVWLTPAAVSSWPTRALRLETVSIIFDTNGNWNSTGDQVTYTNQLLITNAKNVVNTSEYRATYTYRVIGRPQSTVKVVPVGEISSGTQVKHSDTSATGATLDISFNSLVINAALTKSVTATSGLRVVACGGSCTVPGGLNGTTYVAVPYQLKATTTNSSTITIDEFVDTPASGVIVATGSTTITDIGRTSVTISDPVYNSSDASYHFVGPFTLSSATSATLNYTMWIPVGSYINTAYAKLGDTIIGATGSAMSQVTVTSGGTSAVTAVVTTTQIPVVVSTDPATNVGSTTVTINGTVDPNGTTPLTGTFEYGTNANLTGSTVATATTPASGTLSGLSDPTSISINLTGLTSNTTYYYRAVAGTATGTIQSFTTVAVVSTPTVSTQAATTVALTSATLNGTINPNLTSVTGIQFFYSTSPTIGSGTTTLTLDDGTGLAALTAGGSSAQAFSTSTQTLVGGTTYYFKVRACTSSLTGTYPNVSCSSYVDGAIQSFAASAAPTASTTVATSVGASSAVLNGVIRANYATATTNFIYSTVSNLSSGTSSIAAATVSGSASTSVSASISGLSPSTTYYFQVVGGNTNGTTSGTILNFTTSATNRTLTIDGGSYLATYGFGSSSPTFTSTPSAGTGTTTYSSLTPGVCTINATSGLVAFVTTGTCTLGATISASGAFTDASAANISFDITPGTRTLAIDSGSYVSTYAFSSTSPTLTSTPSAGAGTKSYQSTTLGVCTIDSSSGLVSFVAVGTCTLNATIAASGGYGAATSPDISFTVSQGMRTLTIDAGSYLTTYPFVGTPPTLTSTASLGGGTKAYSSQTAGVCTIDAVSGLVAFVSTGTCTLGATIGASGNYGTATATDISFDVTSASRSLTIDGGSYVSTYAFSSTSPTLTSTPSAGTGTTTYSSLTTGVCTISATSGLMAFVSLGTCSSYAVISASGGDTAATSSTISFTITPAPRTLTIDGSSYVATYILSATPPTLTSTATLGAGTKNYLSSTQSVCTIDGVSGLVVFAGTGTCTLGATIGASGVYAAATSSTISFTITPVLSSAKAITSFTALGSGTVTESDHTILITVPFGTDVTALVPTITITGVSVSPDTGVARNFTTPQIYTVTAEDSSTQTYTVTVTILPQSTPSSPGSSNSDYYGCTNTTANNYNSLANHDDGSCKYTGGGSPSPSTNSSGTSSPLVSQPRSQSNQPSVPPVLQQVMSGTYTPETCAPYLTSYIKLGSAKNQPSEVRKLQTFLNTFEGEDLVIDGVYKEVDVVAVEKFQAKYVDILHFWNLRKSTGYVYVATQKMINRIYCEKTKGLTCPYFTTYTKEGDRNAEVLKIKQFLNNTQGASLDTTSSLYDPALVQEVRKLQQKYASKMLIPWGLRTPTGRWYQSTKKTANDILGCFEPVRLDNGKLLE